MMPLARVAHDQTPSTAAMYTPQVTKCTHQRSVPRAPRRRAQFHQMDERVLMRRAFRTEYDSAVSRLAAAAARGCHEAKKWRKEAQRDPSAAKLEQLMEKLESVEVPLDMRK